MALVCLCHGVSERRVRHEIDAGATTIEDIAERCRAGSCCAGCHPTLADLLVDGAARDEPVLVAGRRLRIA
ncbi:MAG: (2Fe-2S)-binding protein [Acidimicrobiia bacterium]|nr:(2Fe-2S)-binding protein [Acidimicrobiia bacterium]